MVIVPSSKTIVLCADDFGLSPGICRGVLELLEARRLSAVSCMAISADLDKYAERLLSYADHADIGLHLVLTDLNRDGPETTLAPDGQFGSMNNLAKKSIFGDLPLVEVEKELSRQLDTFLRIFQRPPDFIDGHQHIHKLPGVRDVVLQLASERLKETPPYVRVPYDGLPTILRRGVFPWRAFLIGLFGKEFKRRAVKLGLRVNNGFSGVYDFSGKTPYGTLFDGFVLDVKSGALVMCHPGYVDDELRRLDSLTDQREAELSYFLSSDFLNTLENNNLKLGRFSEV